jgi:hypothetical protein
MTEHSLAPAPGRGGQASFWQALKTHKRIIGALFLREILPGGVAATSALPAAARLRNDPRRVFRQGRSGFL